MSKYFYAKRLRLRLDKKHTRKPQNHRACMNNAKVLERRLKIYELKLRELIGCRGKLSALFMLIQTIVVTNLIQRKIPAPDSNKRLRNVNTLSDNKVDINHIRCSTVRWQDTIDPLNNANLNGKIECIT
jgi:hypothetical protein